jgi:hypothetical protein
MNNALDKTSKAIKNAPMNAIHGTTKVLKNAPKNAIHGTTAAIKGTTSIVMNAPKNAIHGTTAAIQGTTNIVKNAPKNAIHGTTAAIKGTTKVLKKGTNLVGRRRHLERQDSKIAWESRITAPTIKLDLVIECHHLPQKDSFSQADAFCGVWEIPSGVPKGKTVSKLPARQEREVGRSEVVRATSSPKFTTKFRLEYRFQAQQTYVIRVYDEDLRYATDLKEHDFIGGAIFALGELMGAGGCTIARPLGQEDAFVVLVGREIIETREVMEFRFAGQDLGVLDKKKSNKILAAKDTVTSIKRNTLDKFDLPSPYFRMEQLNPEDQSWNVVWKSEVIMSTNSPTWNVARLPLQLLCQDDDPMKPLKITIWEWNRFSAHELVGYIETSVNELVTKAKRGIPVLDVMVDKRTLFGGVKPKKAGALKVLKSNILHIPSMLQYLSGGCELDLMVAIDCTLNNGNPSQKDGLHFSSESWLNDYQAVLFKIGSIFDSYEGQDFVLWGYGARTPAGHQTFFGMGERLKGANDLVKAYDRTFSPKNRNRLIMEKDAQLRLIIQSAMSRAVNASESNRHCYSTLVILSTGCCSDVEESIEAICQAEDTPLSIVVIGIGQGDMTPVKKLAGGDDGRLFHHNGVQVQRQIVQFVSLDDFHGNTRECVSEALQEVPEQFVQHFVTSGIDPMPPKDVPDYAEVEIRARGKTDQDDGHHRHRESDSIARSVKSSKSRKSSKSKKSKSSSRR